ncbi:hypothetical protein ABZW32_18080 [Streptomyces sp. NPDC004667]|uniref:hypothetical protein n=1 Tax=Streptomyces sp. NPDC004667 TaxID=3154285 RepID=UPI0033A35D33
MSGPGTGWRQRSPRRLSRALGLEQPATEDQQRIVEALARLGEPEYVLPSGVRLELERAARQLRLFAAHRAGNGGSGHRKLANEISEPARQDMPLPDHDSADAPPVSLRDAYVRLLAPARGNGYWSPSN